jgi:hypothetical protein
LAARRRHRRARAQAGPLPRGLHVEGSALIDAGRPVRLLGVNHSGGEYACVKAGGYGVFDSAADDALVGAMLGWHVNTVRLPLNEACWLGLAGVKPAYAGAAYRSAVSAFVARFRLRGVYVVLDLHWSAPGTNVPTEQQPMADEDHAPDFWRSVAATFKADAGVIFDVFNEPYLSPENIVGAVDPWDCLDPKLLTGSSTSATPCVRSACVEERGPRRSLKAVETTER